jgi:hypothetical protein
MRIAYRLVGPGVELANAATVPCQQPTCAATMLRPEFGSTRIGKPFSQGGAVDQVREDQRRRLHQSTNGRPQRRESWQFVEIAGTSDWLIATDALFETGSESGSRWRAV